MRTGDSSQLYIGNTLEEIDWLQQQQKIQKAAYTDISLQSSIDSSTAIDEIIAKAEAAKKTIPLTPIRNKLGASEIRKNRKAEAEKLKRRSALAQNEIAAPNLQKDAERECVSLKSTSSYDSLFSALLDEEDD